MTEALQIFKKPLVKGNGGVYNGPEQSRRFKREAVTLDDTKMRIIFATMKAVRRYGLEGVRIQNVSELAEISPGALYRYFNSKDQLIVECFTYVDRQAAEIFDHLKLNQIGRAHV